MILELQPLLANLAVLLDNCSSLFDCWDTLGAAAAAAVGAGAAAVFVGGLLTSPGDATGIVEEGIPPAPTPTPAAPAQPPTPVAQPGPAFGGEVQPEPVVASVPVGSPAPGPMSEAPAVNAAAPAPVEPPPVQPPPIQPAAVGPAAVEPPPIVPVAPQIAEAGLAAGLAAGVAPVVNVVKAATASMSSTSGSGQSSSDRDQDGQDDEPETCPEADASLFGLPDINTRQDCSGARSGMPPNYAGLDFTSNDDHGHRIELPFESGVSGEVTYVGGAFNTVQVTLENGNRIQFLHASQVFAQVGQQVEPTTVLGRTGGTGPYGPNQYEIHLHVQAFDKHGELIDPDCALSGGENRRLRRKVAPPEVAPEQYAEYAAPGTPTVFIGAATGPEPITPVPQVPVQPPLPQVMPQSTEVPVPSLPGIRCARCGNTSPANSLFCPWCGQTFIQSAAPVAPPPAPPPPVVPVVPVVSPQTIYCGNCGQANSWGSVFCGRCGNKLAY